MTTNLTGIFIPIEVLTDENLSIQEKVILSLVKIMPNGLNMSNARIGELINLSKSRVSEIISSLASKGYVDVKLIYKPNSKQVDERYVTIKQAIKKAQEVVKRAISKAKELKSEYVPVNKTVGTEKVQQQSFGQKFYKKERPFTKTYSHNWDLDELERMERQYIKSKCTDQSIEDMQKRLEDVRNGKLQF